MEKDKDGNVGYFRRWEKIKMAMWDILEDRKR